MGSGDHASNTFSIDGESISDQQSKVFSNQLPSNSVQSMQVIEGAPPAEYGGKTSVVIQVTTRSGLGVKTPTGSVTASYGSFGSAAGSVDLSYGGDKWGNFIELDGLNDGRFLDSPEFVVFHDKGNELNLFDRGRSAAHAARYRTPGLESQPFLVPDSEYVRQRRRAECCERRKRGESRDCGCGEYRSAIENSYLQCLAGLYADAGAYSVYNLGAYVRRDGYNYYPSHNAFADLGPIQSESIAQDRSLTDAGLHTDFSYVRASTT